MKQVGAQWIFRFFTQDDAHIFCTIELESKLKDYFTYMTMFTQFLICHILLNYQLARR